VPVVASLHAYAREAFGCPARSNTSTSPVYTVSPAGVHVRGLDVARLAAVKVADRVYECGNAGGVGHYGTLST
jgi:hypothetical protein